MKDQAEVTPRGLWELAPHETEDRTREEWEGPGIPREEFKLGNKEKGEKGEAYDLWVNLNLLETYITIRQLLKISPITMRTLKEGMHVIRRKRRAKTRITVRVQLPGGPHDVKAVEIEATIVDKAVPNVLIDGGSELNILPAQTIKK